MASPLLTTPPECGERLLPTLIDSIARENGDRPILSIPRTADVDDGYIDISFSVFARAVNYCSWWMDENIKNVGISRTIFYLGPLDIQYLIVILSACKTGRVAFFSSHRNSLDAHLSLLNDADCGSVLVPERAPAILKQILARRTMEVVEFPDLVIFLGPPQDVNEYKYEPEFENVKENPLVILHTSGSTGIPKTVRVAHGMFASNDAHQLIPSMGGAPTVVDYLRGRRVLIALPIFHAACIGMWANGVFSGFTLVIPPARPLTADVVNNINMRAQISGSVMAPSLVIDMYNNPEFLEIMITYLDFVSYVGGSLATEVGDQIARNLKLITLFGTTENMYYPLELHDRPIDWSYIRFSPQLGHVFREWKENVGELVIVKDDSKRKMQGVFSTFPTIEEYVTGDLYEQHPTRAGLGRFIGRSDDIICFNNAEKLNPTTMEAIITMHPEVKSAVIGGNGKFQASLLIEPKVHPMGAIDADALVDRIWATIVKANQGCAAHGRLVRELVILSDPERPLPRSGKTTLQRFAALDIYRTDFENLYADQQARMLNQNKKHVERSAQGHQVTNGHDQSPSTSRPQNAELGAMGPQMEEHLHRVVEDMLPGILGAIVTRMTRNLLKDDAAHPQIALTELSKPKVNVTNCTSDERRDLGTPPDNGGVKALLHRALAKITYLDDVTDDSNLFEHGLDSLQIESFLAEVNKGLQSRKAGVSPIRPQLIHQHPTINQLASAVEVSA